MPESGNFETEVHPKLIAEIESLDDNIGEPSEHGPEFDGFLGMYRSLPFVQFYKLGRANLQIKWPEEETPWNFQVVAGYAGRLLVKDTIKKQPQPIQPIYRLLHGSVFAPDKDMDEKGMEAISQLIPGIVTSDTTESNTYRVNETGTRFGYLPYGFCKDSMLVFSRVYTLNELQTPEMRLKSISEPTAGRIITTEPRTGKMSTLFVEDGVEITDPVRNVERQIDGKFYPLLSFIEKPTA